MTADATVRIDRLHHPVTALGPGARLGIWLQGCPLACPGCMSRHTWDPAAGHDATVASVVRAWRTALAGGADGVTVSGGEPLAQAAVGPLVCGLAEARDQLRPAADILLYTGYSLREARRRSPDVFAAADAVITGRYLAGRPTRLIWRGSANQRLVPLTPRGTARYAPYVDATPERPPLQVGLDVDGVWLIGVPRSGDLVRLGGTARAAGVAPHAATWTGEEHAP